MGVSSRGTKPAWGCSGFLAQGCGGGVGREQVEKTAAGLVRWAVGWVEEAVTGVSRGYQSQD